MSTQDLLERRLSTALHRALDGYSGPHPAWAESPAAARLARRHDAVAKRRQKTLRLLAVAALFALGGAAATGAALLLRQPITSLVRNSSIAYSFDGDIYVVSAGGLPRRIVGAAGDALSQTCPVFSSDGSRLAYSEARGTESVGASWRLVVTTVDGDGRPTQELERTPLFSKGPDSFARCPQWSSDGQSVAWIPSWGSLYSNPLMIATMAGEAREIIVGRELPEDTQLGQFAWSPDSKSIAVVTELRTRTAIQSQIWLVDSRAGRSRLLLDPPVNEYTPRISWSPDGTLLGYDGMYLALLDVENEPVLDAIGHFVKTVATDDDQSSSVEVASWPGDLTEIASGPAWSPDGSRVAYLRKGHVVIQSLAGGDARALPSIAADPAIVPMDLVGWSPDGRRLLVIAVEDPLDVESHEMLLSVDALGEGPPVVLIPLGEVRPGDGISWQGVQP
jgi:Tol biopolymer transport system component